MKKKVLVFGAILVIFTLTAYGFMNRGFQKTGQCESATKSSLGFFPELLPVFKKGEELDLVYNVDSRFLTTITKEDLINAKSIVDILPEKATEYIVSYQYVQVDILDQASEVSDSPILNYAQKKLLQSVDYSTDIYIKANYKIKTPELSSIEDRYLTYFITVTPEKEAAYAKGHDALIEYLRESSREETSIITRDRLQPGKVRFTITKNGTIADVQLTDTSGYPSVDKALVEMVAAMPGKWEPATNALGEPVDQELIFFFGLQGC